MHGDEPQPSRVVFSQLLCDLLGVTGQVPERISDYSNAHVSFRAHVKNSIGISTPAQVKRAATAFGTFMKKRGDAGRGFIVLLPLSDPSSQPVVRPRPSRTRKARVR